MLGCTSNVHTKYAHQYIFLMLKITQIEFIISKFLKIKTKKQKNYISMPI